MTENNNKNFKTVHIEMSQKDYDLLVNGVKQSPALQQILARARVVNDMAPVAPTEKVDPAKSFAPTKPAVAPVVARPAVVKERLTDDVQKRLFGANYNHVCIYDYETQTLMTPKYNGVDVIWNHNSLANSVKKVFEYVFTDFELVAMVTMTVSKTDYPGSDKWSNKPVKFNSYGTSIVGNLVIRNKKTHKLELYKQDSWFGVYSSESSYDAARDIAFWLPFKMDVMYNSYNMWRPLGGRSQR